MGVQGKSTCLIRWQCSKYRALHCAWNIVMYVCKLCMYVCESRLVVSNCATPSTVACQAPLSMGFSRQECWSGLPFPSPGGT